MSEIVQELTRNQRRALQAVLFARSVPDAARKCGLSEKTLYRYMADPGFRRALKDTQSEMLDETGRRLMAGQAEALQSLETIMISGRDEGNRRLAAAAWLAISIKWLELLDLESRVSALEAASYGRFAK